MLHPTPTKIRLATTRPPLVRQLSGSLAHGARLIEHFLHHEPTPQHMATFEQELSALLREVGPPHCRLGVESCRARTP